MKKERRKKNFYKQFNTVVSLMIVEETLIICSSVLIIGEAIPFNVELYIFAFRLMLKPPFNLDAIACR